MMKSQATTISELAAVAPFDQIPNRALQTLAPHVDLLHVRPGVVLAREGQQAREFIVVLEGDVSLSRSGARIDRRGAGSQIGGDALMRQVPHETTWCAESELDVLVINGPAYRWASRVLLGDTVSPG